MENAAQRSIVIRKDFEAQRERRERADQVLEALKGENGALTNAGYELIGYFLPQLVYTNPGIDVDSKVPGDPALASIGLKFAIQETAEEQDWVSTWAQAAVDSMVYEGWTMVTTDKSKAPRYAYGRPITTWDGAKKTITEEEEFDVPILVYLDARNCFIDSAVQRDDQARHMGHKWQQDRAEVVAWAEAEDSDWILEAVRELPKTENGLVWMVQMFVPGVLDDRAVAEMRDLKASAGEDEYVEDPESRFYSGTLYTYAGENAETEIRKPRLYRGPKCGPYQFYRGMPMPFSRHSAAHLAQIYPQMENSARVDSGLLDAIESYTVANFATKDVVDALKGKQSGGFHEVKIAGEFLEKAIHTVTAGGPTDQLLMAKNLTDQGRDRTGAVGDTQRGIAQSDTTATAEQLASEATAARISLIREGIVKGVEQSLRVVAWHMEHSANYMRMIGSDYGRKALEHAQESGMELSEETVAAVQRGEAVAYVGGDSLLDDVRYDFSGKRIKLTPMSMERTSEGLQQRRVLQFVEMMVQVGQLKQMWPDLDASGLAEDAAKKLNVPGMGKYVPNTPSQQTAPAGASPPSTGGVVGNEAGAQARIQ